MFGLSGHDPAPACGAMVDIPEAGKFQRRLRCGRGGATFVHG
jgi:hypothetical protein